MNKTHLRAYSKAITEAALNRTAALEIELAVGFAVMVECGGARRLARETLITIYNAAGWKCDKPGALDWRSVNRHISAAIALYDFIGQEDIDKWAEGRTARDMVDAFRPHISALKVKSVNEVLLATDRIRPPRKPAQKQQGEHVKIGHLDLVIPKGTTRDELVRMAAWLMQMATTKFEIPAVAAPESETALTGETT
jgi:hypothetical protein